MKKIVPALAGIFLCAACHKHNTTPAAGSGFWSIDSTKYNANYITRKDTAGLVLLLAQDTLPGPSHLSNSIAILFGSLPADSGTFQVLSQQGFAVRTPGPGQISVFGARNTSDSCGPQAYFVGPYDNLAPFTLGPPATVKVVNGKIDVVIPPLLAGLINHCGRGDSLFVSASIQQQ